VRLETITIVCALAVACGERSPDAGSAPIDFIVFRDREMVVDRLEVSTPLPVTVGSSPSAAKLRSSAADVVSLGPDGRIVAHRAGDAVVSAVGDAAQFITIHVRPAGRLVLVPSELDLEPRSTALVSLVDESGNPLPESAAQWFSEDPRIASIENGRLEARSPGTVVIAARYGGQVARARILVAPPSATPSFSIVPSRPSVRVGEVLSFVASGKAGPVTAAWSAKDERVIQQTGPSTFVARSPGVSEVCAVVSTRSQCTLVLVRK